MKLPHRSIPALLKADMEWNIPNQSAFFQPSREDQCQASTKAAAASEIKAKSSSLRNRFTTPPGSILLSACCMIRRSRNWIFFPSTRE